jgi:hypothetical protein
VLGSDGIECLYSFEPDGWLDLANGVDFPSANTDVRPLCKYCVDALDPIRGAPVIIIDKADDFMPRLPDAPDAGMAEPACGSETMRRDAGAAEGQQRRAVSAVSSVEALSITTISHGMSRGTCCAAKCRSVSGSRFALLWQQITTDTPPFMPASPKMISHLLASWPAENSRTGRAFGKAGFSGS